MPTISFDDDPPTSPARGPTIVVGQPSRAMPSISVVADAPPSISVQPSPPAPSIAVGQHSDGAPSIAVSGPSISIAGVDDEDDEAVSAIKPSISISHSGPLASPQRVSPSASPASTVRGTGGINGSDAASAPTLGSGYGCGTCGKWIGGRVVSAMGQRFHPACFACSHCSEPLEHVAFYEHEGKAFCHFDYHELFSRRCFHCRTPIVDERFITISDPQLVGATDDPNASAERSYHDLHFFCANCGDPFLDPKAAGSVAGADPNGLGVDEEGNIRAGGREFVVWKGYPYCEKVRRLAARRLLACADRPSSATSTCTSRAAKAAGSPSPTATSSRRCAASGTRTASCARPAAGRSRAPTSSSAATRRTMRTAVSPESCPRCCPLPTANTTALADKVLLRSEL
jgi:hypothetical protein